MQQTNDARTRKIRRYQHFSQIIPNVQKLIYFAGSLYLKITVYDRDLVIGTWKSDRFEPTISMKIESKTATLRTTFRNSNTDNVKILIRLMCKNILAKKFLLGKIEINNSNDLWKRIADSPSDPLTEMVNLY